MKEYKQEQTRIRKETKYLYANDYEITMNIREKYYNMMIKYNLIFYKIRYNPKKSKIINWLKNNGELNIKIY